jgi:hypothetical protein
MGALGRSSGVTAIERPHTFGGQAPGLVQPTPAWGRRGPSAAVSSPAGRWSPADVRRSTAPGSSPARPCPRLHRQIVIGRDRCRGVRGFVSSRRRSRQTCNDVHLPPAAVGTPRSLRMAAARSAERCSSSARTGAVFAANAAAAVQSLCALRPPSLTPLLGHPGSAPRGPLWPRLGAAQHVAHRGKRPPGLVEVPPLGERARHVPQRRPRAAMPVIGFFNGGADTLSWAAAFCKGLSEFRPCRGPERDGRVPLAGQSIRSPSGSKWMT